MEQKIYAIYDEAVESFGTPIFMKNGMELNRELHNVVNQTPKETIIQKYPEQFVLYHLGSYNSTTAKFDILPQPTRLYKLDTLLDNRKEETLPLMREEE